ncbi:MAG: hypothetical protein KAI17_21225 [Thiotrichaceae bacterium]|nr:hypothetical protein [Thiotrichaceae bacterium]
MQNHLKKFSLIIFLFILIASPGLLLADIVVLVHGYHTSSKTWRSSGIMQLFAINGWKDISDSGQTSVNYNKFIIAVELPSKSPIEVQADYLSFYLATIAKQNPGHKIHLVAHSAGGLVARLSLVNKYRDFFNNEQTEFFPIEQLITIATPHLGSPIAEMLHSASDTPIGFFAPFVGMDEINDSEILYKQLSREHKNGFLYWLNRQPHPPIRYTSIVRADGSLISGDIYVPPHSQNMAFVPVINQHSHLILTPGDHALKYNDGIIISHLLP